VDTFADRGDAGRQVAARLRTERIPADAVVLGIPRGGVVVAAEVARELGLPLDVVVPAKVGAPGNPEYAIGAVAPDGVVVPNPEAGYSAEEVARFSGPAHEKIQRSISNFLGDREPTPLGGRTVLVVDDGLATGLTALAAVDYIRRQGAKRIVLAVPVASRSAVAALRDHADDVIALSVPEGFMAVGQFYRYFGQTEDDEVVELLDEAAARG
jgi:putative phosphoribosyl transferase